MKAISPPQVPTIDTFYLLQDFFHSVVVAGLISRKQQALPLKSSQENWVIVGI